jgi:hypothetical protein
MKKTDSLALSPAVVRALLATRSSTHRATVTA